MNNKSRYLMKLIQNIAIILFTANLVFGGIGAVKKTKKVSMDKTPSRHWVDFGDFCKRVPS